MKSVLVWTNGIWIVLALVTGLIQGNTLASTWFSNVSSILLRPEWQVVSEEIKPPDCRKWLDGPVAAPWIAQSLALDPQNERAWLQSGREHWLLGKCNQAKAIWQQASLMAPADDSARLLWISAEYSDSAETDRIAGSGNSDVATYFFDRGLWAVEASDFEAAIEWYEISLLIEPNLAVAETLANLNMKLGLHQDALATWQRLSTSVPETNPDHWFAIGQMAKLNEEWEQALDAFETGAQIAPNPFRFYYEIAGVYKRLKDFQEAKYYYESALQLKPGDVWSYIEIGNLELQQENYEEALVWFERATEIEGGRLHALYYLGIAYWKHKSFDQALEAFHEIVKQKPDHHSAWHYLGLIEYDKGHLIQAIEFMEKALVEFNEPGDPLGYVYRLGGWYVEADRCDAAIAAYEQVLKWQPQDSNLQERLDTVKETCLSQ